MTGESLLQCVIDLSNSQGFYGRLLRAWKEQYPDELDLIRALDDLITQCNIKDYIDFILLMEDGGIKW